MSLLEGKKVIIIGDRDGIPGDAIAECAVSAGAEVVYSSTECFLSFGKRPPGKTGERRRHLVRFPSPFCKAAL